MFRTIAVCTLTIAAAFAPPRSYARAPIAPLCARQPSKVSRVLNKVSFGLLGAPKVVEDERPFFFHDDVEVNVINDGANYVDELEAFMDTPAPRPKTKRLKEPTEAPAASEKAAPKELKESREAMASAESIAALEKMFGQAAAPKAD
eukprot:CAMPEP_0119273100 /NCGR_PEP_ID=MMETSP1329-20130426/9709_1 /TAXON_ID=114041 /ORGANISM="Genus nov. species nov., Strain RCC1024" /LENGTH=146 /DNA_ID=CAMNT_0007273273 /DNA_START=189 /DNA_END=629 /DNA_ORIENTATION=-